MPLRINERIKKAIDAQNVSSLNKFSKRSGIAQSSLFKIIQGDTEPRFSMLERLLVAIPNLSAEWLMRGLGNMTHDASAAIQNNSVKGDNNIVGHNNVLTSQTERDELIRLRAENDLLRGEVEWLRSVVIKVYSE